jgi:hypothetical protein
MGVLTRTSSFVEVTPNQRYHLSSPTNRRTSTTIRPHSSISVVTSTLAPRFSPDAYDFFQWFWSRRSDQIFVALEKPKREDFRIADCAEGQGSRRRPKSEAPLVTGVVGLNNVEGRRSLNWPRVTPSDHLPRCTGVRWRFSAGLCFGAIVG